MLIFGAVFAFVGGIDLGRGDVLGGIGQAGMGLAIIVWIETERRGRKAVARVAAIVAFALGGLWLYTVFAG